MATTMNVSEVHEIMTRGDAVLIDVRSEAEFAKGHAKGFVNIPLDEITKDPESIPKSDTVYFMCHSGGRSSLATKIMIERGVNAVNIEGGFFAWKAAGLPVE